MCQASGLRGVGTGDFRRGCESFMGQARGVDVFGGGLRNEANLRGNWLRHRGWQLGNRGGLEVLQGFEGAEEHAVGGIDAPVKAGKGLDGGVESVAERGITLDGGVDKFGSGEALVEDVDAEIPELGFDSAEAPLDPLGGNECVDERELDGIGGAVVMEELFGKGV